MKSRLPFPAQQKTRRLAFALLKAGDQEEEEEREGASGQRADEPRPQSGLPSPDTQAQRAAVLARLQGRDTPIEASMKVPLRNTAASYPGCPCRMYTATGVTRLSDQACRSILSGLPLRDVRPQFLHSGCCNSFLGCLYGSSAPGITLFQACLPEVVWCHTCCR